MAETVIKTYQLGDQNKYKVDDLVLAHQQQENHFYNYLKDKKSFTDEMINELRNLIHNKYQVAIGGSGKFMVDWSTDSDGIVNRTAKDGKSYDLSKAANYYFSKIAKNFTPYTPEDTRIKWDNTKHGFGAYLEGNSNLSPDQVFAYDSYNTSNQNARRAITNRRNLLKTQIDNYITELGDASKYNFDNDNHWDDDYIAKLTAFKTALNNTTNPLSDSDLYTQLSALAGSDYARAFTHTGQTLEEPTEQERRTAEAQRKADAERSQEEAKSRIKQGWMNKWAESMMNNSDTTHNLKYYAGNPTPDQFYQWYFGLTDSQKFDLGLNQYYLKNDNQLWSNAYTRLMNELKTGTLSNNPNDGFVLQRHYLSGKDNPSYYIPLNNNWQLLRNTVSDDGWVSVYNPTNGEVVRTTLYKVLSNNRDNATIQDIYKTYGYNWIQRQENGPDYRETYLPQFNKQGGTIPKYQYGNNVNYEWYTPENAKEVEEVKEQKFVSEVDPVKNRPASEKHKSELYPNAGLTASDKARLVALGTDIVSLFLEPVTGVVAGVGSTLMNFGADWGDDGLDWGDVKNLGINLGFDLAGVVPIIGDTLGTGSKIIKGAARLAPIAMTALSGIQGVKNFNGMMTSWGKLLDSKEDNTIMTVQDWQNIAQSINLITGGIRWGKNKAASERMKSQAKVDDAVAVELVDANGNTKRVIVNGDIATNIRAKGNDKTGIETELAKLDEFKNVFKDGTLHVNTGSKFTVQPFYKDPNKPLKFGMSFIQDAGPKISDVYDFSRVPAKSGSGISIPIVSPWLNKQAAKINDLIYSKHKNQDYTKALTVEEGDQYRQLAKPVQDKLETLPGEMEAYNNQLKQKHDDVKAARDAYFDYKRKVRNATDYDLTKAQQSLDDINSISDKIKTQEGVVHNQEQVVRDLQSQLNIKQNAITFAKNKKEKAKYEQQKKQIEQKLQTEQTKLDELSNSLKELQTKSGSRKIKRKKEKLMQFLQDVPKARSAEDNWDILSKHLNNLEKNKRTESYTELENILRGLQQSNPTIGPNKKPLKWDMETILKQAGIKDAFKYGGSINKNKLNKFLNYAKG